MGYTSLSCNAESAIATCDSYRKPRSKQNKPFKLTEFSYSDLQSATNDFSQTNFLGKGSYGTVYKALFNGGSLIAAVKKTKIPSNSPVENEIEILSRVRSPRLVNLLGFGVDPNERKLIVVEFMPNGSLYDLLHSTNSKPPGWTGRFRFALQVAKAIQHLHLSDPPVIHRDIKSSNILIDGNWNARLGDFGLSLRGHVEDVRISCTPPAGTLGYLDPGYLAPGDLSTKSDVFSFGILLLEIISGRNAIDMNYSPPSVVDWAVPLIKSGDFIAICDRRIGYRGNLIKKLAVLAVKCVRATVKKRPTMTEVVECLRVLSKRIKLPIFSNIGRGIRRSGSKHEALDEDDSDNNSTDIIKTSRVGSRRNRKVSSVPVSETEKITLVGGDRIVRSKSIGSVIGIKLESLDTDMVKRRGVTVKLPTVRLSKSRSTGVLRSTRLVHNSGILRNKERVVSKLLLNFETRIPKEKGGL